MLDMFENFIKAAGVKIGRRQAWQGNPSASLEAAQEAAVKQAKEGGEVYLLVSVSQPSDNSALVGITDRLADEEFRRKFQAGYAYGYYKVVRYFPPEEEGEFAYLRMGQETIAYSDRYIAGCPYPQGYGPYDK